MEPARPRRLDVARQAGIGDDHIEVVQSGDVSGARDAVLARTEGRGADLVIECTGAPAAVEQGTRMTRRGGSYLIVGQYTDAGDTMFNPHQIVHRQLDILGSWAFTGAHLAEYVRLRPSLTRRFDVKSLVTRFPLARFDEALRGVEDGTLMKAVLTTY